MIYIKILHYKKLHNRKKHYIHYILVENELYTSKEFEKLKSIYTDIQENDFTIVNIPKNKTYCFFGARFSNI